MIITEKKQITEEVIIDVICDFCGKSCKAIYNFEYAKIQFDWGYGTKFDGDTGSYHMCEKCFEKLKGELHDRPR